MAIAGYNDVPSLVTPRDSRRGLSRQAREESMKNEAPDAERSAFPAEYVSMAEQSSMHQKTKSV